MSNKFTPITLTGTVATFAGSTLYGESDGTGLQSQYRTFNVSLSQIAAQAHADASTREPLLYNGLDLEAGMFLSDDGGSTILKIVSISAKTEQSLTCVCEDIDMVSFRLNNQNSLALSGKIVLFDFKSRGRANYCWLTIFSWSIR